MRCIIQMRAVRYVSWLHRHTLSVLIATGLLVAGSVYLAMFHLPLQSDFAALLPADLKRGDDACYGPQLIGRQRVLIRQQIR